MTAATDRYLAEVERRLPGGRRTRADHLDELRDGLLTAAERTPTGEADYTAVVTEFGRPADIAAALAREIHLREARRGALRLLAVLLAGSLLWYLYRAAAGSLETLVPDGPTRPVFLAGTDIVRVAPVVSMIGAALLALAASLRVPHAWIGLAQRLLAAAALAAAALFGLAVAAIAATVNPAHRPETLTVTVPAALLAAALLRFAFQAAAHSRRAHRTRAETAPGR